MAKNDSPAPKKWKRYTITSALPYANGPVHIGHLAGVYLPADIYARYLRLKGEDVIFIGGSDEHGVPITIKARQENCSPQDVVDKFHRIIEESFEKFGISFDVYSRTTKPIHHETAAAFFYKLYESGKLIEIESEQYFDETNNQFLADRYIVGICPHCSNDKAYGDQCENCGTSLSPIELINPRSVLSGNKPIMKKTKHWYLPLQDYEPMLKEWILEGHKQDWKSNVYGQCKSWIDQGLMPRAVTRDLDWGVKVPVAGTEGKVLYVWFDAPIGYISATKEWSQKTGRDWTPYWKSEDSRLVHFIGKDNIVFHCIIFPAMLRAEGSFILPDNVPANEFLNLEGNKISTSRNWAVWLHEYLEEFEGKQDVLRYVLCSAAPETKDNDFTWKDFQARNNNELLAIFGNFVNRTLVLTHKYFEGKVPDIVELTSADRAVLEGISGVPARIENYLDQFRFRDALNELMNLARLGNKYLTESEPWKIQKTDPQRVQTILNIALQICANLAILCEPFLPFTKLRLSKMLNMQSTNWGDAGKSTLLLPGHLIGTPELLFEKIEDPQIQNQIDKLINTKTQNEQKINSVVEPFKDLISYEEFSRMDIRIVTIVEAEKIAQTKKLLKLTVDTGAGLKTVVSGIAEYYSPEEIKGKQVAYLANLQPKVIRGVETHGMILMASNPDGSLAFVQPDKLVSNGGVVL